MSIADHHLGRPYDNLFETFQGQDGRSLFLGSSPSEAEPGGNPHGVIVSRQNMMMHEAVVLEDVRSLRANASLLGVASGRIDTSTDRRYAVYRAWQITEVHEIDDTLDMRDAPPGAVWYLSRVYYGHAYQVVFTGNKRTFNAGVKARFLSASGSIDRFTTENKLETRVVGRGLLPAGTAIFARTPDEIASEYRAEGTPSPIFVEYRLIPGATAPPPEQLAWEDAPEDSAIVPGRYKVARIRIWVGPRGNGLEWDVGGGYPDPMVDVYIDGRRFYSCRDRDVPVNHPMQCDPDKTVTVTDSSDMQLKVTDKDISSHDPVGSASVLLTSGHPHVEFEMQVKGRLSKATVQLDGPL